MSVASRQLSQLIVAKLLVLHHLSLTSSILKCHSDNLYYNILVPSRRLRILAVLSSGCKATFEGLPNVQCSSTTHKSGRATMPCWQNSKNFHFRSIKGYSIIPYSAFYELPIPNFSHSHSSKTLSTFKVTIHINKSSKNYVYILFLGMWRINR